MADIQLSRPAANQTQTVTSAADARFVLAFPTGEAKLTKSENGENLVMTFDDGAKIEVEGFYTTFDKDSLPTLNVGGQDITGEQLVAVLGEDLMPAAGPGTGQAAAQGGRFRTFADADLNGGIDRLGGLDIGFDGAAQQDSSPENYYALTDEPAGTLEETGPEPAPMPTPAPTPTPTPAPEPFIPPDGYAFKIYDTNSTNAGDSGGSVYLSGLPGGSGTGDTNTTLGNEPLDHALPTSLVLRSSAGVRAITLNGKTVVQDGVFQTGVTIDTPDGLLTVTGFAPWTDGTPSSGEGYRLTYTYELQRPSAPTTHNFAVTVTDNLGQSLDAAIVVNVVADRAPGDFGYYASVHNLAGIGPDTSAIPHDATALTQMDESKYVYGKMRLNGVEIKAAQLVPDYPDGIAGGHVALQDAELQNVENTIFQPTAGTEGIKVIANITGSLIRGGADDNYISSSGNLRSTHIDGGEGNDSILVIPHRRNAVNGTEERYWAATIADSVVDGGDGNDMIGLGNSTGGAGFEANRLLVDGGAGDDTIQLGSGIAEARDFTITNTIVDGGAGNDAIKVVATDKAKPIFDNNVIDGGAGDDTITVTGDASQIHNTEFHGGSGDDVLNASKAQGGNLRLFGDDGNDSLTGGTGNDYLHGGSGADAISGGAGNDLIVYDIVDNKLDGGEGIDFVLASDSDLTMDKLLNGWQGGPLDGPHAENVEVLIKGGDALKLTSVEQMASQYGITVDGDKLKLDTSKWTEQADGSFTFKSGADLTLEVNGNSMVADASSDLSQAVFALTTGHGG